MSKANSAAVVVVDYGLGNLLSLTRALAHVGAAPQVTSDPDEVRRAGRLILPGVGAFADGMEGLRRCGLIEPVREVACAGRPVLGICLGMQLLFGQSEEFGLHEGLGIIAGRVVKLAERDHFDEPVKVPHIGWSGLLAPVGRGWDAPILDRLFEGDGMYFVHSYAPVPEDARVTIAEFLHGGRRYCAAVEQGQVVGFQCHPEKSGDVGLQVLRNFLRGRRRLQRAREREGASTA